MEVATVRLHPSRNKVPPVQRTSNQAVYTVVMVRCALLLNPPEKALRYALCVQDDVTPAACISCIGTY